MDIILQRERKINGFAKKFTNKPDNISTKQARRYTTIQLDIIHTGDCLEILKGLLQNQVIFAAAPFFFKEGNPGSAEHYIFRLKRSRLMQKA